nr:uncharacterized protein LOC111515132 [Leptinotarsa decemlineata]
MKCIAVFVVVILALAHASESDREEAERYHLECQKDPASRIGEGAGPNSFAAHTLCVGVKMGTFKPNGDVDVEGLRKFLIRTGVDPLKIDRIVHECSKRNGVTAVEAAMGMMGCLAKWTAT